MADDEMATTREPVALTYVQEANTQLRALVHQFLTKHMTLTPDEAMQVQHELAALSMGRAWLHARLQDIIVGARDE
jgi:hypothetical protein